MSSLRRNNVRLRSTDASWLSFQCDDLDGEDSRPADQEPSDLLEHQYHDHYKAIGRSKSEPAFGQANKHCLPCRLLLWCQEHSGFQLVKYHQVPEYMQSNPFILEGYRPLLPVSICLKSLFSWNNETLNIWSHLLGLLYFVSCFFYDNLVTLPRLRAHFVDHVVVSTALVCFMICMMMSAAYHLFFVISERAHRVWFLLDLSGVSIGLMGIYLSGIYYGFYCDHVLHNLYLSVFGLLAFMMLAMPLHPLYHSPKMNTIRYFLYAGVAAYGVIPTIHFVAINDWFNSDFTQRFLPNVVIVYALSIIAFATYITMVPERFLPGWFDYFGQSHNWWHVLVMMAMVYWRTHGNDLLLYRLTHPCPA